MSGDGRWQAWAIAWQMLQHAEKLRTDPQKKQPIESPPDLYWGWLAEAKIYAQLATVDLSVGISSGAWLEARERDEAERIQRTEELVERMERRGRSQEGQND